jgi:5,10-methylenetetrahydromethanopterin reductase
MTLKLDIQAPMNLPASQIVEYMRHAEEMGFDGVGMADHMEHGRDVYTVLAMAAQQTQRIELFPCVSNPVTRHPWVLANIAHTMDEAAPGRFRLVIGAGDTAVMHIGKKPARVAEMREAIVSIGKLLRGEPVSFGRQQDEQIIGIQPPGPPVVVAAGGERMTELAGEAGDEAFLLTGHGDRILKRVRRDLEAGAARLGRSLAGFKLTHYTVMRIERDEQAGNEFTRGRVFGWIKQGFFKVALEELGLFASKLERPEDLSEQDVAKLKDALFIVGPAEKITERLQEIARARTLDRVVCVISGADGPAAALDTLAREIMPRVK